MRKAETARGQSALAQPDGFFSAVYAVVRTIPKGRVATYGLIAALLGAPRGARAVGWAMRALPKRLERDVPWHRVVGHGGRISLRGGDGASRQRQRLRAENVRFVAGNVDMLRHDVAAPIEPLRESGRKGARGATPRKARKGRAAR